MVITGYPTIDTAVGAMQRGAYDFLPKPFSPDELRLISAGCLQIHSGAPAGFRFSQGPHPDVSRTANEVWRGKVRALRGRLQVYVLARLHFYVLGCDQSSGDDLMSKTTVGLFGLTGCAGDQLVILNCEDRPIWSLVLAIASWVMKESAGTLLTGSPVTRDCLRTRSCSGAAQISSLALTKSKGGAGSLSSTPCSTPLKWAPWQFLEMEMGCGVGGPTVACPPSFPDSGHTPTSDCLTVLRDGSPQSDCHLYRSSAHAT